MKTLPMGGQGVLRAKAMTILLVAVTMVGLTGLATSCEPATRPEPVPEEGSVEEKSQSASEDVTEALGAAWFRFTRSGDVSWSSEPPGDVGLGAASGLVFARVLGGTVEPDEITFDACQLYHGEYARREAAKDDPSLDLTSLIYVRNQYEHEQKVPIMPGVAVILQNPRQGDIDAGGMRVVSYEEFIAYLTSPLVIEAQTGYWLVVDQGQVTAIVESYVP